MRAEAGVERCAHVERLAQQSRFQVEIGRALLLRDDRRVDRQPARVAALELKLRGRRRNADDARECGGIRIDMAVRPGLRADDAPQEIVQHVALRRDRRVGRREVAEARPQSAAIDEHARAAARFGERGIAQVAHASIEPVASASIVSAGGRKRNDTASGGRPAASSAFSVTKWPIEPRVVPMRLPFRSAAPFSVASGCTSTAVPYGSERFAPITLMRAPDASAKITGASPIGPQSTAAAFSASASGAAAGNSVHAMSYARPFSSPAASSSARSRLSGRRHAAAAACPIERAGRPGLRRSWRGRSLVRGNGVELDSS